MKTTSKISNFALTSNSDPQKCTRCHRQLCLPYAQIGVFIFTIRSYFGFIRNKNSISHSQKKWNWICLCSRNRFCCLSERSKREGWHVTLTTLCRNKFKNLMGWFCSSDVDSVCSKVKEHSSFSPLSYIPWQLMPLYTTHLCIAVFARREIYRLLLSCFFDSNGVHFGFPRSQLNIY